MSGFWKGYANVNDDVRHTYEQVFYGRQLTGNLTEAEVPGMKAAEAAPQQPQPDAFAGATGPGVTQEPSQHDHAEFYNGIWGETLPPEPEAGGIHGSPQLDAATIDGTATPGAPQIEAPTIEAPKIEPPSQGDDQTPGY